MRFQPALLAAALMAAVSCAHSGEPSMTASATPAMFEVEVPNISDAAPASSLCATVAAERGAHWPGLFWTQRPGGPSTCVLTAGAPGVVEPIIAGSNCAMSAGPFECIAIQPSASGPYGEDAAWARPGERVWIASNSAPVALYERHDTASHAISEIGPGAHLVILDFQSITYFSHRGIFRAPYALEGIEVGQAVVPTFGTNDTPWIDGPRYDPTIFGSDVMTSPEHRAVRPPPEGAPRLEIAWEELPRPANPRQFWALVKLPDGSIGWADFEALGIELGLEDE